MLVTFLVTPIFTDCYRRLTLQGQKKCAIERVVRERYGFSRGSLHILRMPFGQLLNCMCLEVNGIKKEVKLLFTAH